MQVRGAIEHVLEVSVPSWSRRYELVILIEDRAPRFAPEEGGDETLPELTADAPPASEEGAYVDATEIDPAAPAWLPDEDDDDAADAADRAAWARMSFDRLDRWFRDEDDGP